MKPCAGDAIARTSESCWRRRGSSDGCGFDGVLFDADRVVGVDTLLARPRAERRRAVLVPRCRTVISLLSLSLSLTHTHTHTHSHNAARRTNQRTHTDDFFSFLPLFFLLLHFLTHGTWGSKVYICALICVASRCWHVGKSECSWLELCVCATS